jgi:hypothetical protein
MGDVAKISRGVELSISQIAAGWGITRETASKRVSAANIRPSNTRGGHPVYLLPDVVRMMNGLGDSGDADPDKMEPYKRQAHYKAELDRLKLEQETRELIPRIEVEQEQAHAMRAVALMFDTLPDVLERDCGLSGDTLERVERHVDDCREQLHKLLTVEEGEEERA